MTQAVDRLNPSSWPDDLIRAMNAIPAADCIHVAVSGGLDSIFLLHAVSVWFGERGKVSVCALHVNHQLQRAAATMETCCRRTCDLLGIPLSVTTVDVAVGENLENRARNARYAVFEEQLQAGELLLMAHHANDQAETVLFRLIRGSGSRGLAGIPRERALGDGCLFRPLLDLPRERIRALATAWQLDWVDDPSNDDPSIDRNFLRHRVIEPLSVRWPGVISSLGRSARQSAEATELGHKLAQLQLRDIRDEQGRLAIAGLSALSQAEQKNLLRWWLIDRHLEPPGAVRLEQGLHDLLVASADRLPELVGENYAIRRFQGHLYCVVGEHEPPPEPITWNPLDTVVWAGGYLRTIGDGVPDRQFTVTVRTGGERLRPRPGGPTRPLKKWLQEQGVPPWERERLPLVWAGDELVAVGSFWLSPTLFDNPQKASWRIIWGRDCR
ncbi:tRNA lysidine(34) synthetase TilS [Marinobacter nanhaiticus D15-8W]|uniref:tRNA(Ile)-lysidine synthase n=1 Tax=Marinobacter nanhaiticus D15-8W TaxID=626887 RepID=N6WTW4_9GAMM|nr:tRNA lysidine(34) synthetase TilS [Marinobacter nanhaiticus]ENO14487.1 tRNA lysidine(34) synthetase TilS [Marinobacter nanhaiticus D15-8W]BES71881.1 tRNA lysidine(34) synthetase TilS [Marinobacter nanhaiticus D15-8W]